MNRFGKNLINLILCVGMCLALSGCTADELVPDQDSALSTVETAEETAADETSEEAVNTDESVTDEDYTEGLGDTLSADTVKPDAEAAVEESVVEEPVEEEPSNLVDLIFFMGQSNMSGCGGDASLCPVVTEDKGQEYRSVSDPTRLYPITEPFGINENRIGGLMEYPSGKKGSLVSAFINEYYELTNRKVVAVSASKGETSIIDFTQDAIMADIGQRYAFAKSYLSNNGYTIGHIYVVWLQGESDALDGVDPEVYRTKLDDFMRPMFIDGLEKVFIITPGRTYSYSHLYDGIVSMQKKICAESGYYALATNVLSGVSTEYMTDMYHYNQHVLNMVGIETAKSVAYYTLNKEEKIVFDYIDKKDIVPEGVDPAIQIPDPPLDLSNINEKY